MSHRTTTKTFHVVAPLVVTSVALLAACSSSNIGTQAAPSEGPSVAAKAAAVDAEGQQVQAWRKVMAKTPAPGQGCFTVTAPSTTWTEEPCATAVNNPLPAPRRRLAGAGEGVPAVGSGTDWSAQTSSGVTSATGSFPVVTGVSSESSDSGVNAYSLQINTNSFATSLCNGGLPSCVGAMQVVFYGQSGNADIWYVLENYYSGPTASCPSGSGWRGLGGSCYLEMNGYQLNIGAQPISNLKNLILSGVVGSPNITMTISAGGSTTKSIGVPNSIGLTSGWTDTEFNVFGDGNGDSANINGGATIEVQTEVQTASGSTAAPGCVNTGSAGSSTAETNDLTLVPGCCVGSGGASPSITFLESNAPGASCTLCGGQGQACCGAGTACGNGLACELGTCIVPPPPSCSESLSCPATYGPQLLTMSCAQAVDFYELDTPTGSMTLLSGGPASSFIESTVPWPGYELLACPPGLNLSLASTSCAEYSLYTPSTQWCGPRNINNPLCPTGTHYCGAAEGCQRVCT